MCEETRAKCASCFNKASMTYVSLCKLETKNMCTCFCVKCGTMSMYVSVLNRRNQFYISQKIHTKWWAEFQILPRTSNFFRGTGILFGLVYSLSQLCAELYHAFISKHNVVMGHQSLERMQWRCTCLLPRSHVIIT